MKKLQELEIEFESKAADYAQSKGGLLKKCVIPGERDYPDRQGYFPNGHVFFIEFKRPGEKPRRGQLFIHNLLRKLGFAVHVCKSYDSAKIIIDKEMQIAKAKGDI